MAAGTPLELIDQYLRYNADPCGSELAREGPHSGPKTIHLDVSAHLRTLIPRRLHRLPPISPRLTTATVGARLPAITPVNPPP